MRGRISVRRSGKAVNTGGSNIIAESVGAGRNAFVVGRDELGVVA